MDIANIYLTYIMCNAMNKFIVFLYNTQINALSLYKQNQIVEKYNKSARSGKCSRL